MLKSQGLCVLICNNVSCPAEGAAAFPHGLEDGCLSDDEGDGGEEKDKKKKKLKKKKKVNRCLYYF